TLSDGMKGDDVRQLQQALTALGYGHLSNGTFDVATQIQVKRWYEHAGYEPPADADKTTVPSGEILFLPTLPVRVDTVTTRAGATRVQVQGNDGSVHDVPVRVGLTANGLVEVSGTGLAEGARVVVGSK